MIAHLMFDPERKHKLFFPNKTHCNMFLVSLWVGWDWLTICICTADWVGRITLVLGYVTLFLGFGQFELPMAPRYMFGILLFFFGYIAFFQEFVWLYEHYGHYLIPALPGFVTRFMKWSGFKLIAVEGNHVQENSYISLDHDKEYNHLIDSWACVCVRSKRLICIKRRNTVAAK